MQSFFLAETRENLGLSFRTTVSIKTTMSAYTTSGKAKIQNHILLSKRACVSESGGSRSPLNSPNRFPMLPFYDLEKDEGDLEAHKVQLSRYVLREAVYCYACAGHLDRSVLFNVRQSIS